MGATVPEPACWYRTSERHFTAALGRIGRLMIWANPGSRTWSVHVLGTEQNGFVTAAAAKSAAIRLARQKLVDTLQMLKELEA